MSHQSVLFDMERDASAEVAEAFARVVSRVFESTRDGNGPVSTPLPVAVWTEALTAAVNQSEPGPAELRVGGHRAEGRR